MLGDAGSVTTPTLAREEAALLAGSYIYGAGGSESIDIAAKQSGLTFTRKGTDSRGLIYLGDRTFHPAGAAAVRIRFIGNEGGKMKLTVEDPGLIVTGTRAGE